MVCVNPIHGIIHTEQPINPLEIPNHRVERVDEMTISYILRAIQAYATTAEGRQDSLGDDLYQRIAYEAVKRVRVDGAALTLFSS